MARKNARYQNGNHEEPLPERGPGIYAYINYLYLLLS